MTTPKDNASEHESQSSTSEKEKTDASQTLTAASSPQLSSKIAIPEPKHTPKLEPIHSNTSVVTNAPVSLASITATPATSATSKPNSTEAKATTTTRAATSVKNASATTASISKIAPPTNASTTAPKRIQYTKQQMLALAKERISLQRPANLPVEAVLRSRYRDNNNNNNVTNNSINNAKDKILDGRDRESHANTNRDRDDLVSTTSVTSTHKTFERPTPKELPPKPAESKARKGDRYGTPSWFTEEIDANGTFTFGTLDREADRAQMGLAAESKTNKLEEKKKDSKKSNIKQEDDYLDEALEGSDENEDSVVEEDHKKASLPAADDVHLHLPQRPQTPEVHQLDLPALERVLLREPSNKKENSQPTAGLEQGPWNTWPSLFGPLFPGFASQPSRHDPWSDKHEKPSEVRKSTTPVSSASDQTAALKNLLKIGGSGGGVSLNSLTSKPSSAFAIPSTLPKPLTQQPEWTSEHVQADSGWNVPKRESNYLPSLSKSKGTNTGWPSEDLWQESRSGGWQETGTQDAEWREGISGWQASETDSSNWSENGRSARAEWHSRDPRAMHQQRTNVMSDGADEVIMFRPGSAASETSSPYSSFNSPYPVDAQWSNPTVSVTASSNAATVAKRSATVNVQTLFNMNLPNRNPPPRAVMASTLENRQLVRAASLSHSERERTLDAKVSLSRPTVSFTQNPTSEYHQSAGPQDGSLSEHMARMVTKAHLQRKTAPTSPPSVTFSNRQPPMRYSQNQFGRSTTQGSHADASQHSQPPQLSSQQQQAMFFQQNSQFILQHSQQPTSASSSASHYQSYPSQQVPQQQQTRTSFSGLPTNSNGNPGPLDKWFGHMLTKPNVSR